MEGLHDCVDSFFLLVYIASVRGNLTTLPQEEMQRKEMVFNMISIITSRLGWNNVFCF